MAALPSHHNVHRHIAEGTDRPVLDVLGPTIEFLTSPDEADDGLCVMRGVIPPGVVVPIHSHDDAEAFYILPGTQQVLTQGTDGLEWNDARAGDYIDVPRGTPHAHRNVSHDPAVDLLITTARLGRFFQDVGKPATDPPQPPSAEDVAHFIATSVRYGYTLGTPEENKAVGIDLPKF
jgi:quercetin dioxygenase-like cupin family protein